MPERGFVDFARQVLAAWLDPRPRASGGQLIQFSQKLPAGLGTSMVADYPPDVRSLRLGRLMGHYGNEVWVYVSVTKISQSAALVPLRPRRGPAEDDNSVVLEAGPLHELLDRPNDYQSRFDFVEQHQTSMELAGESFLLLERGPSALGEVEAMYVLPLFDDETMTIIRSKGIRPDKTEVTGYIYQVGGEKVAFLPDEIVHIRYPNPFNPYRGLPPLRAAALSVTADLMAQEYNVAFFTNSAEPRGHYEAEGIVQDAQRKRFEKLIEMRHKGYKKAHRPLVLSNMKWVSTQLSPKDAEFLDQRKFSREEIIAIYGVRPVVVGLLEHNPQANAEIQWRDFWTATMQPKMAKLTNALNEQLAPLFGSDLSIEWDYSKVGPLQENYSAKVTDAVKLNSIGYPINEINRRLNLGFDDMPWGNDNPLEAAAQLAALLKPKPGEGNGNGNGKDKKVIELHRPPVALLSANLGGGLVERKRAALDAFEARQSRQEKKAAREISDFFDAQRKRTIKNLKSELGARAIAEARGIAVVSERESFLRLQVILNGNFERALMAVLHRGLLRSTVVGSILSFIAAHGYSEDDFDFTVDTILEFLENESANQADCCTETTVEALAQTLTEGIQRDEDVDELKARIDKVFDKRDREAKMIARTETTLADNFGTREAANQAGLALKAWISARDERVREAHAEIDNRTFGGQLYLANEPFVLIDGSRLQYPGDTSLGASLDQIINCRCTAIYLQPGEQL